MFRLLVALTILTIVTATIFERDSEVESKHEVAVIGEEANLELEGQSDAESGVVVRAKRYYGCGCGCCGCGAVSAASVTAMGCGCGCCGCGYG